MLGRAVMLGASAAVAGAGFLPWVRTGERERSAFELIDAARVLEVLDSSLVHSLAIAFYFVPLAAALCWVAVFAQQPRLAAALAIALGLLGLAAALSIESSPATALAGVRATLIAAMAVIVGGIFELAERQAT